METSLKQRLLGASLVIALSVVFIPMLIDTDDTLNLEDRSLPNPPTFTTEDELPNLKQTRERIAALPDEPTKEKLTRSEAIQDDAQAEEAKEAPALAQIIEEPVEAASVLAAETAAEQTAHSPKGLIERAKDSQVKAATPKVATSEAAKITGAAWAVQVATFASKENAQTLVQKLKQNGMAAYTRDVSGKGRTLVRVYLGPELDKGKAAALQTKLQTRFQMKGMVVAYHG